MQSIWSIIVLFHHRRNRCRFDEKTYFSLFLLLGARRSINVVVHVALLKLLSRREPLFILLSLTFPQLVGTVALAHEV